MVLLSCPILPVLGAWVGHRQGWHQPLALKGLHSLPWPLSTWVSSRQRSACRPLLPGIGPWGAVVGDAFPPSWAGDGPGGHPAEVPPPRCPPARSPPTAKGALQRHSHRTELGPRCSRAGAFVCRPARESGGGGERSSGDVQARFCLVSSQPHPACPSGATSSPCSCCSPAAPCGCVSVLLPPRRVCSGT